MEHSFSPLIHNAAFQEIGYNGVYLPFPIKNLTGLKYSLRQLRVQGLSVTIPHKIRIRRIVDKIHPLALKTGSVNTIVWNEAGLLEGFNTDGLGAIQAIREFGFDLANKKVLIIGSGGSARSIAFALLESGISGMGILSRNRMAANVLLRSLRLQKPKMDTNLLLMQKHSKKTPIIAVRQRATNRFLKEPSQLEDYHLIINTTPLGMRNHSEGETPLGARFLHKSQIVFDIVYNPQRTKFIQEAQKKKLDVIYGYKMLLYQGALQFRLFTGLEPPAECMENVLVNYLSFEK